MLQPSPNNLRFPGQYADAETGLHYNFHRYYDPKIGRYGAADPIGFDGGDENLYAYVWNAPVNWGDPFGLKYDNPGGARNTLNTCEAFIETIIMNRRSAADAMVCGEPYSPSLLGDDFLEKCRVTLPTYNGFKIELVGEHGEQGGEISRHIYGHAGAILSGGLLIGGMVSLYNQYIDYDQRFRPNRSVTVSEIEIADDKAAREVAGWLFLGPYDFSDDLLRKELRRILCR